MLFFTPKIKPFSKFWFNPILPWLLNTLQTRGGVFYPLLIRSFFILEAWNLACRVLLVISFDFNFKICEILMYDVTMSSFLCFRRRNGLKAKNVIMTSNWRQTGILWLFFQLSGPKLVPIPNFSSISLQMADFSLFFGARSCEVPSVILLPWQQLKT